MKQSLGNLERKLFALAQLRGRTQFYTGDLVRELSITPAQEKKLYARLASARMIARVRRGMYLVPSKLPLGALWTPGEGTALNALMQDRAGTYQICGPNAFNRYGYDEQIPNRVYAYNNRLSGDRTIGAVSLTLVKVADDRLGGVERSIAEGGDVVVMSSRARTLVDAVYDWSRFGTLPRAYGWIRTDLDARRVAPRLLVDMTIQFGDVGTRRRIGYLLDQVNIDRSLLKLLERSVKPTSAFIPFNPMKPKIGKTIPRWGVVDNE
jgi:predicted transcriptional regulator of viral defense system